MKKTLTVLLFMLGLGGAAWAQGGGIDWVVLDATTNGTQRPIGSGGGTYIVDDGDEASPYTRGQDYWVCISGTCDTPYAFLFRVESVDIAAGDTLFIYDGPDPTYPLLWYSTRGKLYPSTASVFASPSNIGQFLTVRLKTAAASANTPAPGNGFMINVKCEKPCESITPHIDSIFYKTRNGQIYEFGRVKLLYDTDSVMRWDAIVQDSVLDYIDSTAFWGVNLCRGDGVIFTAHCDYSRSAGWYDPQDSTSIFEWSFGNQGDSAIGVGLSSVHYDQYYKLSCYDVTLHVTDVFGCKANSVPALRVRLAQDPLKTLFTLDDICNSDSLLVNMGYDGDNATLTLKKIDFVDVTSKTYDARTFIPDGDYCGDPCYVSELEFSEFPAGSMVQSKGDICSICINAEHSFIGDFDLAIICPNYDPNIPNGPGKATLKRKEAVSSPIGTPGTPDFHPEGTGGGGSHYLGFPFGGDGHGTYDDQNGERCDTLYNPAGVGWTYCFSRNRSYTLVNGDPADTPDPRGAGLGGANVPMVSISNYTFDPIPAGYYSAGSVVGPVSFQTIDSSDHLNKMNYYVPFDEFDKLVGCPLNGVWQIQLCDRWHVDNGWIFSWSLDICGLQTQGCKYQVGIDSIIWTPDTAAQYHDYELGHYRGCEIHRETDLISYILTPDTAGTFPINITIYDEFGCVWDTNTSITSFWTPQPSLGNDTALCGVFSTVLDATDRHTNSDRTNYTYSWHPFGETTPTISTQTWPTGDINYVAQVTNNNRNGKKCVTRDTLTVHLRRQPLPSFMPTPFTLEGCDPLTLTFNNQTIDGYTYHWDFGDGITSELASPTHTYSEGIYDLKYYTTSIDGCVDSLIYPQTIAVYAAPQASFSWSPTYPSVTNPVINLQNLTSPDYSTNKYFWEMQYNQYNPLSVETLTDHDPVFDYTQYVTSLSDLPGNYTVRLIARTDNLAPSGNMVYCRDTAENTILVVNDYLTFPSVVTPNGDGINDIFVIGNLIEGMGFPNNTLDIYNRWGTQVYHRDNIATYDDFWDPSNVPAGTYFYRFVARGYNGNVEHNGSIEVIK